MYSELDEFKIKTCNVILSRFDEKEDYIGKPINYPLCKDYYESNSIKWIKFFDDLNDHNKDIKYNFIKDSLNYYNICDIIEYLNYKTCDYCFETKDPMCYKKIDSITCNQDYNVINKIVLHVNADLISAHKNTLSDSYWKYSEYLECLKILKSNYSINRVCAAVYCNSDSIYLLPETVKMLTDIGIYSDIRFKDIQKSNNYDDCYENNSNELFKNDINTQLIIDKVLNNNYLIEDSDKLLKYCNVLPSEMECEIYNNIKSITVDYDLKIRLCERIRGKECVNFDVTNLLNEDSKINDQFIKCIKKDYFNYCLGCNSKLMFNTQISH